MAERKRSDFQRESDYERITSLYLRGWRQADIAVELGLSQGQISQDLRVIQKRWRESTAINMDEAKQKELARLDELEREYWQAWESSKSERTKARQETDGTKDKTGKPIVKKSSMEKEQRDGNPAFLQGVLSCIDRRCKLLGLDAPIESKVTGKIEHDYRGELLRKLADLSKPGRTIFGETGGESTTGGTSADPELAGTD